MQTRGQITEEGREITGAGTGNIRWGGPCLRHDVVPAGGGQPNAVIKLGFVLPILSPGCSGSFCQTVPTGILGFVLPDNAHPPLRSARRCQRASLGFVLPATRILGFVLPHGANAHPWVRSAKRRRARHSASRRQPWFRSSS